MQFEPFDSSVYAPEIRGRDHQLYPPLSSPEKMLCREFHPQAVLLEEFAMRLSYPSPHSKPVARPSRIHPLKKP
jgi:hypothetical protein